jgi:hypothetical protein
MSHRFLATTVDCTISIFHSPESSAQGGRPTGRDSQLEYLCSEERLIDSLLSLYSTVCTPRRSLMSNVLPPKASAYETHELSAFHDIFAHDLM